jgi:non-specific serine/threonine protein kinase
MADSERTLVDKVVYECSDLRIDLANRRLTRGDHEVALEPKALATLVVLLERPDELVTRDELLDAVWGHRYISPAALNRVMGLLRRVFDDDADHPHWIRTVHGAGYRFIGSVRRVSVPQGTARARFGLPPGVGLPAKLEHLIGRTDELERLCDMLARHRAVTIVGAGGMGKTQCALEAARLCSGRFPDGVWFFDLSALERAQEWLVMLAAALSVQTAQTPDLMARIASALVDRRAQFVLDNCDRLASELGTIVLALLRACPGLSVLSTSRQRLDFTGEHLMWLQPLALPPPAEEARHAPVEEIAAIAAVELLLLRVAEVQPSIALTPGNVGDIIGICRRLDGMPLALELAAAQFAMLPAEAIHVRLREHFGLLASTSAGREPRHQTLQALVDWSFGLLSSQEQRLLCWLGVFVQGWTAAAAERVGAALGMDGDTLLELHSGLILKSFVIVDPTLSPPRYRMLETVREFALRTLRERVEEAPARQVHLEYVVQIAERSHDEMLDGRLNECFDHLRHEHANLESGLNWALSASKDPHRALRLAGSLMLYAKVHGPVWLVATWVERALAQAAPETSATYLRALLCSGVLKLYIHDPAIEARLAESQALAQRIGDRWAQSCAAAFLALWKAHRGHLEDAARDAELAGRLADAEADDWLRSLVALAKGWIALGSGHHDDVVGCLLPFRRISFDPQQHAMVDMYLAMAHFGRASFRDAARSWSDVMETPLRMHNVRAQGGAMEGCAYVAVHAMRPDVGARLLGKAAEIRERSRLPLFSFWNVPHQQAVDLAIDRLGKAEFDRLHRAGATARDEVVVEEARVLLREFAGDQAPSSGSAAG